MSSMDQVFVKAFSRRRLATSEHRLQAVSSETPVEKAEPSATTDAEAFKRSQTAQADDGIPANVDQIARADQGKDQVPRHHLNGVVSFELPAAGPQVRGGVHAEPAVNAEPGRANVDPRDGNRGSEDSIAHGDPLQHIHTAYAGAFGESSIVGAGLSLDAHLEGLDRVVEARSSVEVRETDSSSEHSESFDGTGPAKAPVASPSLPARVADLDERPETVAMPRNEVAVEPEWSAEPVRSAEPEPAIDPMVGDEEAESPSVSYVPFQAVWEVDVFDVPAPVADLFFEGALFQQIAERMSDAVGSGLRSVLVTSSRPGEGRSSVAIGMAMAAAAAGIRVALVDADIESPSLADELRLDLQYGWVDVIRRGLPIKEIAVQAVEDGVTLIPLMPPGVRPAANAFEMVQLMDLLKHNFELIILDGPTALSPSLNQCACKADSAVIVRDVTQTDEGSIGVLASRLQGAGVRGVGVVENFV